MDLAHFYYTVWMLFVWVRDFIDKGSSPSYAKNQYMQFDGITSQAKSYYWSVSRTKMEKHCLLNDVRFELEGT